jgi:hypothetical protein
MTNESDLMVISSRWISTEPVAKTIPVSSVYFNISAFMLTGISFSASAWFEATKISNDIRNNFFTVHEL